MATKFYFFKKKTDVNILKLQINTLFCSVTITDMRNDYFEFL